MRQSPSDGLKGSGGSALEFYTETVTVYQDAPHA
jgi:hypothetical protein